MPNSVLDIASTLKYLLSTYLSKTPVEVVFPITYACNQKCRMCRRWQLDTRQYEMSLSEIKGVFSQLRDFGINRVNLTGGEPLLRRDIFEVIEFLHDELGFERITFTTNGLLLNEKRIRRLASFSNLRVIISLDSLSPKVYADLRGPDVRAFHLLLERIKLLKRLVPNYPLRIHAVISSYNYDEIDNLIDFAKANELKLSAVPYNYKMQYEANDEALRYGEEIIPAFRKLASLADRSYISGFRFWYLRAIDWIQGKDIGRCNAGREVLYLNINGDISPCPEFAGDPWDPETHHHDGCYGNLLTENIRDIYRPDFLKEQIENCSICFLGCYWGLAQIKQNKLAIARELLTTRQGLRLVSGTEY